MRSHVQAAATIWMLIDRLSKNLEEEEENTMTFRLKCIVIA